MLEEEHTTTHVKEHNGAKSYSGLKKATDGIRYSMVALYALTQQQSLAIQTVGPVRNEDERPFPALNDVSSLETQQSHNITFSLSKRFY
jgi:hypothetical protein